MKIGAPKELFEGEARVALTPQSAQQLQKLGHECLVESGAGAAAQFSDQDYRDAGVEVVADAAALFAGVDVVAKVRPPEEAEVDMLREGQTLISFFYPAQNGELMERAKAAAPSSQWTWCPASAARRRWTRSAPWPTSPVTAR